MLDVGVCYSCWLFDRKDGYIISGSLAERLRVLRAQRGMTLVEAAEQTGVGRDTLSDLERGRRHPVMPTLAKIAQGYGVPVEDLLEEPALAEKDEAPREAGPANVHQLFAEHQARPAWLQAFDESLRFRSQAEMRLREQLSLWEAAKHEEASYEERRKFLDATGRILDEASSVSRELIQNLLGVGGGLAGTAESGPNTYWTECQIADTLYRELFGMVGDAGLSVHPRPEKTGQETDQAPGQSDQALGQWQHEVRDVA
jgi:transcriptional regulator with XRE-family HTH domain